MAKRPSGSLRDHKPLLEVLRLMQEDWIGHLSELGDSNDRAILRGVMIGWMEGRLFDKSALALATNISLGVVGRHLDALEARGWVKQVRIGHRVEAHPTEQLLELAEHRVPEVLQKRVRKVR